MRRALPVALVCGALVACPVLGACSGPAPGVASARSLDVDAYRTDVHAVLEPRCATLDCHGDAGRPMRLYAETGLRRTAELRLSDAPLSDEEGLLNVEAIAGVDPEVPVDESRVLLKPLAPSAGGMHHRGRAIWLTRDDDAYVCVSAWLAGTLDDSDREACTRAANEPPYALLPAD